MSDSATAVVFVHGAGGGGWEWRVWSRIFAAAGHAVFAPDLRPSGRGLAQTTLADYVAQARSWVEAARAAQPRVAVVGASLGGLVAASIADHADALVLVNPMPPSGLRDVGDEGAVREWGRRASLAGTRAALPDADAFTTLAAWRAWRDESAAVLAGARAGVAMPAPKVPCLVIASDADEDVPEAVSVALAGPWRADLLRVRGSHVGPLLGRAAAGVASQAVTWLNGSVQRR